MPAVAGGDQDRVDIRPGQQLVEDAVGSAVVVAVLVVGHFLDRLAPLGSDIADGDELHFLLTQKAGQIVRAARRRCR